jgi:hypothetical protein
MTSCANAAAMVVMAAANQQEASFVARIGSWFL